MTPGPDRSAALRLHVCALIAYSALAVLFTWPLPLHLATHLTGSPEGDTGVYVWNQWVFRRELITRHANPYFTDRIFALTGPANLSLNNYTTFANLLALPLIGLVGVVASFNLIYIAMTILSAYAMFLLVRALIPEAVHEAWLAGAVFAWSPMLVTRGAAHFSLVAAAPLPLFVLFLIRIDRHRRLRDAIALGLILAVAHWSDAYYSIYCVMLAAAFVASRLLTVEPHARPDSKRSTPLLMADAVIVCLVGLILLLLVRGGWVMTALGHRVSIRELYTPVLLLTVLVILRMLASYNVRLVYPADAPLLGGMRLAICAGVAAAIPLSPWLYALAVRIAAHQWVSPAIYWRSSPIGVDLLSLFLPNPNHPLAPEAWRSWLSGRPDGYLESVASIPISVLVVLALAWRHGWRAPRLWVVLCPAFAWMALGPFLRIAGVNTYVPGPWALLRYAPIIGLARNPARLVVLAMLALSILFACALHYLRTTRWHGRPWVPRLIGAVVLLELLPVPRGLYSAGVPAIYAQIKADPRDVTVLELPFGVRDGTFSLGNYTARTQYFQTLHGKAVVGGDLSRVSKRRVEAILCYPILDAFIQLSEGRALGPRESARLNAYGPGFAARSNIGYVVIDRMRASPELVDFAKRTLHLEALSTDGASELYRPAHSGYVDDVIRASRSR